MATLGLLIFVIFLFFIFTRLPKNQKYDTNLKENWDKNPSWRSSTPNPYYKSAEYKKFSKQRKKKYEELKNNKNVGSVEGSSTDTQFGKKGGRYEERISKKTGKTYRHYF